MRAFSKWIKVSGDRAHATVAKRAAGERGSALVEISFLAPWILFLFVGAFDVGMYSYSLITVENAARVAAEYTSSNSNVAADQHGACTRALAEMGMLPNVNNGLYPCNAAPVTVSASSVTGTDGSPATSVSITYQGASLVPIPGLLMGQLNVTRTVQMRVSP
ncbi:MAG TPA: TadE/TadG family type IV pilus assembly protein [Bryobacteraceae bacterium]|nr:TadE/TadG family type IV pilus assembly protein [Bryobacteraceae bacterium]